MIKKIGVLFFVSLFFLSLLSFANSQNINNINPNDPLGVGLSPDELNPDDLKDKGQEKWDYLEEKWRQKLVENPVLSAIDSVLVKLNVFFIAFFNITYDMFSFRMWFVIILWFIFAWNFETFFQFLNSLSTSNKGGKLFQLSTLIAVGLAIIFAQIGVYNAIASFFLDKFFAENAWYIDLMFWGILIFFLIILYIMSKISRDIVAGWLEERERKGLDRRREKQYQQLDELLRTSKKEV